MQAKDDQPQTIPHFWVVSIAILAVGALLRLPSLTYESLWVDEFITLRVSQSPLLQLPLAAADLDSQPPVFHFLVKAFITLGASETSLRLASALAGLAAIPAMGWIAKQLSGSRAALIAMAILAVSPFHVWYSQEARGYTLVLLLLILSVGFLLRMGDTARGSRLAWAGFIGTTALALYTHLMALPFLLVQVAIAVVVGRNESTHHVAALGTSDVRAISWRRVLLGQMVALALFLPQAVVLFRHAWLHYLLPPTSLFLEGPTRTFAMSPDGASALILAAGYGLFSLLAGFSLGPSVRELHGVSARTLSSFFTPEVLGFSLLMALSAWLAFRSTRRRDLISRVGFLWTSVVFLAIPIAVFFAEAPFRSRYVAIALPGLVLWLTGGVSNLRSPRGRNAAVVALVAAFLIPLGQRHDPRYVKEDVRSAARYLSGTALPGTEVVVCARSVAEGLRFYLQDRASGPAPTLEVREYPSWGVVETKDHAEEEFRSLFPEGQSGWLLLARPWENDQQSLILSAAEPTHWVERRGSWPGVQLFFLQLRTALP